MNVMLSAPVSAEEIRKEAFNIKGSSAPGEDGLTEFSIKNSGI